MLKRRAEARTAEHARALLAERLRGPVKEEVWQYLVKKRFVKEYCDGFLSLEGLAKEYQELNAISAASTPARSGREIRAQAPPDRRLEALSRIVAAEMERSPLVAEFRREVLGGRLIAEEDIPAWIEEQDPGQGLWYWICVRIPIGEEEGDVLDAVSNEAELLRAIANTRDGPRVVMRRIGVVPLAYPCPDGSTGTAEIRPGGRLARLKWVASYFAAASRSDEELDGYPPGEYPFLEEAEAVRFILSGRPPRIWRGEGTGTMLFPGGARVRLDVDARMSAMEVAKLYLKIRRRVFEGQDKPMTEKHLQLAVCLAEHFETSWPQLMASWNAEHPEWAYTNWRNFARDAKAAWCRVTGREWIPRRGGTERTQEAEEES